MADSYDIILTGATGMVGGSALRLYLDDPAIGRVLSVARKATGLAHPKLEELLVPDLTDVRPYAQRFAGYQACIHCMGVSAAGMSEADYTRLTYTLTVNLAEAVLAGNPQASFIYVSGQATDSSEKGMQMWARVKGRTENAVLAMPFAHVHCMRPGFIEPLPGVRSATGWYNWLYILMRPFFPVFRRLPKVATTARKLSYAMLRAARHGYPKPVLENMDINLLGA